MQDENKTGDISIVLGERENLHELPKGVLEKSHTHQFIYKTFKELIDLEGMNQLFRDFYEIVGVPIAIIDLDANVLASSDWNPICTQFHRVNADSCAKCLESDISLANDLSTGKPYNIYKCRNGMTDSASPIIIEGEHIANLFVGQYLLGKPDILYFSEQADKYGYNKEKYLEALANTPIVDEKRAETMISFLVRFAKLFAIMGLDRLREKEAAESLKALNENLEKKVEERTKKIQENERFIQTLVDSQEQLIITTDGINLRSVNKTFLDFFSVNTTEEFMEEYSAKCICDTFNTNAPEGYLQISMGEDGREPWIDYVISRSFGETHKAMISIGNVDFIFSVSAAKLPGAEGLKSAVFTNITEMEKAKEEIEAVHKHTRDSIEYASLIQEALIPDANSFKDYFSDYFAIWKPNE